MLPIGEYTTTRDPRPGPGARGSERSSGGAAPPPRALPPWRNLWGEGGGDNAVVVLSCTNVWERWAGMQK